MVDARGRRRCSGSTRSCCSPAAGPWSGRAGGSGSGTRRDCAAASRRPAALGLVFVVGQIVAWRQLAAQGIFLTTNPHSSFFYVLTAIARAAPARRVAALAIVTVRTWQGRYTAARTAASSTARSYWHFLDLLWVYLFVLLFWVGTGGTRTRQGRR